MLLGAEYHICTLHFYAGPPLTSRLWPGALPIRFVNHVDQVSRFNAEHCWYVRLYTIKALMQGHKTLYRGRRLFLDVERVR